MKKLLLLLLLSFFSAQSLAGSCPDGSDPVKSISADGTYFVFNCGGGSKESNSLEISSYENLDLTSIPKKVLSERDTNSLWNAYKTAPECFEHPSYGKGFGYQLKQISNNDFKNNEWITPFFNLDGDLKHEIQLIESAPKPIVIVKLDETYGEENEEVNRAREFFKKAAYVARIGNSDSEIQKVKTVLLDWAENDALKEGINVSWGDKPVDWQMMMLINAILTTTATMGENINAEERQIIGPWLNTLIQKVAKSNWKDRQDNKAYLTSYMTLIWGLMVNDLNAVQNSIDVVKLAVHDMRPDGSLPIDTQRSGMGIKYNSDSFAYLLMMASILKDVTEKDLYLYKADGRSLLNGANFVIKSVKEPSKTNSIYAISCPGGGDRWGSVKNPSKYHIESSTYLLVYAHNFPKNTNSDFVIKKYNDTFNQSNTGSNIKSKPSGVFTLHPMLISSPPGVFLLNEEEVIQTSNSLDGSYSFTISRFNENEGSRQIGNGYIEINNGIMTVAKDGRTLDTGSIDLYDSFEGQIDKKGNFNGSLKINVLNGKSRLELVSLNGSIESPLQGEWDDYFDVILKLEPVKEASNSFDGSYAFMIRTEPDDGEKNIGTAQFIIKDGKISVARKYRYLLTSAISTYDTFEGEIDKEGNINVSFELNPIRYMVEPKTIKFSGSMDSLQLRGRFDGIKFWDNNTKAYVTDENFHSSFYDVIIDFKKEKY